MPTLSELVNQLQYIGFEAVLLGLFITGSLIIIARDWRFLILTLLIQYVLAGLILAQLVRPDIAVLGVLIGAFICPILYLSARQVAVNPLSVLLLNPVEKEKSWWKNFSLKELFLGKERTAETASPTGVGFRVFVVLLMMLVTVTVSESFPLTDLPPNVTTAVYWLGLTGLTVLALTEDPMKVGHGIFTTFTGFWLLYSVLERSLLLTGLWGTVNLLIALAIGYLTVVKGTGTNPEESA
jgi:hypothetical protein